MANREAMNDFLTNRWVATSAPAAGTTCVASASASGAQGRVNLETLLFTIDNRGVSTGLAQSVTVNVSNASIGGTVIASIPTRYASSSVSQVSLTSLGISGKRGKAVVVSMNTVIASLVQVVNIAGWNDD